MKMRKIPMGATYLRQNTKRGKVFTPILPSLVRVFLSADFSNTQPAKIEMNIPPRGRRIFDEVKSKRLKKLTSNHPKRFTSLK